MKVGERMGRLVRTSTPPINRTTSSGHTYAFKVECECDCGTIKFVHTSALCRGTALSCGCLEAERRIHGGLSIVGSRAEGRKIHPLYIKWRGMQYRCYNVKCKQYHDYGGRGITICDEWLNSYRSFYDWAMANGWQEGLEIDRRENDQPYRPDNCRFVSQLANANNKRGNRLIAAFGENKTLSDWVRDPRCSVSYRALQSRLKRHWEPELAIIAPPAFTGARIL